jgi:hypothetical protein
MLKVAGGGGGTANALVYQGTWNASSNVPTLASGVGTKGYYYVVSVAGSTNLDGETLWGVGDWAVFNGSIWQKVNGGDTSSITNLTVTSLTGYMYANNTSPVTASTTIPVASVTGAVSNTVNVIAGTNLTGGGALTGNVTINNPYNGTVTNVATGTGLTGGPITSTGTISLANTTVTAGTYGNASSVATFTVTGQGQLNAASNTAISIPASAINTSIPNSGLTNSSVTINGTSISLGGSGTISASTTGTLTLGTGLTGTSFNGSANVTTNLANTAVVSGSYGNASTVGSFTVDAQGRLTSASNTAIAIAVAAVSGAVPNTVNVIAGTGLTGGGALTGNVTLTVAANTTQQLVTVQNNGVAVGTRQVINFIPGTNITLTTADDSANGRANVTIATSGFGTMATQNANAVAITGGTANLTSANITYTGASSNIGLLSVGGAANITADTGLIASFVGNATNYSYIAVQNKLTSNTAYGSYSLYNDLGTIYADFGINSSNYSYVAAGFPNNSFSLPNATFIQSGANSDLTIGTNGANAVHLLANGSTSTSDALTINANNTVTIANLAAGTSSTATFATPSLPLVPAGYLTINLNGTNVKIPYYAV